MIRTSRFIFIILAFIGLATIYSCSNRKNTFTRRVFHNITARYNVYFNGNESFKEGLADLDKNAKDNFTRILPIYKYGTKENAQAIYPQMDRAIEKSAKAIRKHSIFIKGQEHVKMMENCYMLMAKAQFYKQDYKSALRTFDYVIKTFKKSPVKNEASIWKSKLLNIQEEFDNSAPLLDDVQNLIYKKSASNKFQKDFSLAYADFYIRQENYTPAIDYILTALSKSHTKKEKIRLNFILAQIYQANSNCEKATYYYKKVLKRMTPYEMSFNSRINIARCFNPATTKREDIEKMLMRMLKDIKNLEYKDQIYYALADIALKNEDTLVGLQNLKTSVSVSTNNNYQRTASALMIGDISFKKLDYVIAQAYYDTALQFLPKDYPDYVNIESKTKVLTELVKNLQVVQLQDSLQRLAGMTEAQRNAVIDKIIQKIVDEENRKKKEESDRQMGLYQLQSSKPLDVNAGSSSWYFYNTNAKNFGYAEFQKKWGKRKLEDLWVLSNKQVVSFDEIENIKKDENGEETDSVKKVVANPKDRKLYMKDIPMTKELVDKSNEKIVAALYSIGFIYKEGLNDEVKAMEAFESLITRFPKDKRVPGAYYQLYVINLNRGKDAKAAEYKNILLTQYAETDYAKLIADPQYYIQMQAVKDRSKKFYEQTYNSYQNKEYGVVVNNADTALVKFKADKVILPKFEYLKAISLGKLTGNNDTAVAIMKQIVQKNPENEVKGLAQNFIDVWEKLKGKPLNDTNSFKTIDVPEPTYEYDPDNLHFYVLIVDSKKISVNSMKNRISDFNTQYYKLSELTISNIFLNETQQIITINKFKDKDAALDYYTLISSNTYVFSGIEQDDYYSFVVSDSNYPLFYKKKDREEYLSFFQKNYLMK
ncbi:MAG: tetratricopeptide repeat protein [Bacteroidota bacterium]